jgi:hypothetical protein
MFFDSESSDRGANSIPTKQSKNTHALWDGLLGRASMKVTVTSSLIYELKVTASTSKARNPREKRKRQGLRYRYTQFDIYNRTKR